VFLPAQPAKFTCRRRGSFFDQVKRLVGPSINTSIKYGQDFIKETIRGLTDTLGLSCTKIDGLDFLNHDEASHLWIVDYRNVEWKLPISVG